MSNYRKDIAKLHKKIEKLTDKKIQLRIQKSGITSFDESEILFGIEHVEGNYESHTDKDYGNFILNWENGKVPKLEYYSVLTLLHEWGHALDSTIHKEELSSEELYSHMISEKDICLYFVAVFYLELSAWYYGRCLTEHANVTARDFDILNAGNIQNSFNNILELAKGCSKENELYNFLEKNKIDRRFVDYDEKKLSNLYQLVIKLYKKQKPSI